MFRQALRSFFTWRISRDLAIGDGLLNTSIFAASTLAGGGLGLAIQHFKKCTRVDESASRNLTGVKFKKWDMEARFERWIVEYGKTYRDEEEKAMRFQLFKAAVERMESLCPPVHESLLPEVSYMADFTKEERRRMLAHPDGIDTTEYNEMVKSAWDEQEKFRREAAMEAQP